MSISSHLNPVICRLWLKQRTLAGQIIGRVVTQKKSQTGANSFLTIKLMKKEDSFCYMHQSVGKKNGRKVQQRQSDILSKEQVTKLMVAV